MWRTTSNNARPPCPQETKKANPSASNSIGFGDCIYVDEEHKSPKEDIPVPMFLEQAEAMPSETDEMEEVEMEDIVEEPVMEIDSCDAKNPLAVVFFRTTLNWSWLGWGRGRDLGDRLLFLGKNSSVSLSAVDYGGGLLIPRNISWNDSRYISSSQKEESEGRWNLTRVIGLRRKMAEELSKMTSQLLKESM